MWILVDRGARMVFWAEDRARLSPSEGADDCSPERAGALLDLLLRDPLGTARLARLLHEMEPGRARRDARAELRARFALLVRTGRVRFAESRHRNRTIIGAGEKEAANDDAIGRQLAEVSYQVVDDASGDPIKGVRLVVTLPDGSTARRTTDGEGMVRFKGLRAGRCGVRAERGDEDLLHVLAFVAFGLHAYDTKDPAAGRLWDRPTIDTLRRIGARRPKDPATAIVAVVPHRVRTGETLASIAERYELTTDALVKFNFGTTERREVERHLCREVGCRQRDPDSGEYRLTSKDKPGILYVPRPWEAPHQTTDNDYVIRVRRIIPYEPPFVLSA